MDLINQAHKKIIKQLQVDDYRTTNLYKNYMEAIGWLAVDLKPIINLPHFIYIKKLPISKTRIGYLQKLPKKLSKQELSLIQRKINVSIIKMDFNIERKNIDWKNYPYLINTIWAGSIQATTVLDLSSSTQQMLKKIHYKTRYNIKKNIKNEKCIFFLSGKNVLKKTALFEQIYQINNEKNANANLISYEKILLKQLLTKMNVIVAVYKNKKALAFIIFIKSGKTLFYTHNASNKQAKKEYAPTLLIWKTIKNSLKNKINLIDFEGIYDEENYQLTKTWKGFSRFKQSFGTKNIYFELPKLYYNQNSNIFLRIKERKSVLEAHSRWLNTVY